MAWKPGPGWPSSDQLTYIASLVTIAAAGAILLRSRPWR